MAMNNYGLLLCEEMNNRVFGIKYFLMCLEYGDFKYIADYICMCESSHDNLCQIIYSCVSQYITNDIDIYFKYIPMIKNTYNTCNYLTYFKDKYDIQETNLIEYKEILEYLYGKNIQDQ